MRLQRLLALSVCLLFVSFEVTARGDEDSRTEVRTAATDTATATIRATPVKATPRKVGGIGAWAVLTSMADRFIGHFENPVAERFRNAAVTAIGGGLVDVAMWAADTIQKKGVGLDHATAASMAVTGGFALVQAAAQLIPPKTVLRIKHSWGNTILSQDKRSRRDQVETKVSELEKRFEKLDEHAKEGVQPHLENARASASALNSLFYFGRKLNAAEDSVRKLNGSLDDYQRLNSPNRSSAGVRSSPAKRSRPRG